MSPLEIMADSTEFSWIESALRTPIGVPPRADDLRVLDLVPPGFGAYAKILHSIWENPELADAPKGSVTEAEKDLMPHEAWSRRVTWEDLATRFDVPYDPALGGFVCQAAQKAGSNFDLMYGEGTLQDPEFSALIRLLDGVPPSKPCYFWWWLIAAMGTFEEDTLVRGALSDLKPFLDSRRGLYSPTYWWPEDRLWCVATDWDAEFTMFGGSVALVDAVLALPEIEGFRMGENDVVLRY